MFSPSRRLTTQYPRFTGLVRRPGEFLVRKAAIGSNPPRPNGVASSIRVHESDPPDGSGMP